MNAYLQRADDFITQQIYKFEQKKQGREFANMADRNSRLQYHNQPSRAQTFINQLPPQGPPAPLGWTQEFDARSQRWYYLERSTGHSQWEPPSFERANRHTVSRSGPPQHGSTFNDEEMARRLQEEENNRGRSSTQFSRPQSGSLGVPQAQHRSSSVSPHPSPQGRLPPGAHFDMRTGQIMYNIFPRDHPINAQY